MKPIEDLAPEIRVKVKQDIIEIINIYGHIIPLDAKVDNHKFASLINANYSLSNPITNKAYKKISEARDLLFRRKSNGSVSVVRI